jgi:hypothetical protein
MAVSWPGTAPGSSHSFRYLSKKSDVCQTPPGIAVPRVRRLLDRNAGDRQSPVIGLTSIGDPLLCELVESAPSIHGVVSTQDAKAVDLRPE